MNVVILCAGIGSRLDPLTNERPKCLVRAAGTPILEHQLSAYIAAGVKEEDIILATGYKNEMIEEYLQEHHPGVRTVHSPEFRETNNMFSLYLVLSEIGVDTPFMLSNGDCVYDPSIISEVISDERARLIASEKGSYAEESMKIVMDGERVAHISKQITKEDAYGNSIDLYKFDEEAAAGMYKAMQNYIEIQKDRKQWSEVALNDLLGEVAFEPFDIGARDWVEIDNKDDLGRADQLFSEFSLEGKRCMVFDLDGVVYLGGTPYERTVEFIRENPTGADIYFMTNNTSKSLTGYVEKLQTMGVPAELSQMVSPLIPLVQHLKKEGITKVHCVANQSCVSHLEREVEGLTHTTDPAECQAVIVAYDTELTYEKLRHAALLLQKEEMPFLATHVDVNCPTEDGPIPDIGSILALLEASTGRTPDKIFGKPDVTLLSGLIEEYGADAMLLAGDRLYTDKKMADEAGVAFVGVLSGEATRADIENEEQFPAIVVNEVADLAQKLTLSTD